MRWISFLNFTVGASEWRSRNKDIYSHALPQIHDTYIRVTSKTCLNPGIVPCLSRFNPDKNLGAYSDE